MTEKEIKSLVNSEIKKFMIENLDEEIKKILANRSSKAREETVNTIRNAFDAVYRVMWQKKSFWQSEIK